MRLRGRAGSSRRRSVLLFGVLAVLVLGVTGGALFSIYHESAASAGVARTVTVSRGDVEESVSASGNVSPVTSEDVDFSTSGTVNSIKVALGQTVRAGEVLATEDSASARANLQSAEASLLSAKVTLADAEQGGTTAQVDQEEVNLDQERSTLTEDEETLTSDETALSEAETRLAADESLGCPPSSSSSSSTTDDGTGTGPGGGSGSNGTTSASVATTRTDASAPATTTGSASSVMTTSATLTGSVDPDGASTSYWFEWGTTTSFGNASSVHSLAPGGSPESVSVTVTGLQPATSYIFRLVAKNSAGTTDGAPQYFTTATSSCVVDQQTVTSDQQAVQQQEGTVSDQEETIAGTEAGDEVLPSTIAADKAQVSEAELTVETDRQALAGTVLRAPISGTITSINGAVGETASGSGSSGSSGSSSSSSNSGSTGSGSTGSGSTGASGDGSSDSSSSSSGFLTITNLKDFEVVVGFAEADATKIAVGQPAVVTLSALPSTTVVGKVVAVSDVSTVVSDVVTYDETIQLVAPPSTVKDGMTALVSVTVASADNAVEVPSAAITTTGTFSTVTVKHGTSTSVVRVTLGLVGSSTTQILSGVSVGETLVEPTVSVNSTSSNSSTSGFPGGGGRFTGGGFTGLGGG